MVYRQFLFFTVIILTSNFGYAQEKAKSKCIRPYYSGGEDSVISFVKANAKYPDLALENRIEAEVPIFVVIDSTGSLKQIEIFERRGWNLEDEALELVKRMPPWIPAKVDGQSVTVACIIPVRFKIVNVDKKETEIGINYFECKGVADPYDGKKITNGKVCRGFFDFKQE